MSSFSIPFRYPHGGIVIGRGGNTVKGIAAKTGTRITTHKADHARKLPLPYFLVEGPHQRAVNEATIQIQSLLLTSMMNAENQKTKSNHQHDGYSTPHAGDGYSPVSPTPKSPNTPPAPPAKPK